MKKTILTLTTLAGLVLSLTGCATTRTAAPTPAAETPAAGTQILEAVPETARQDGERFETVIMLEGMEETVKYEHIRSAAAGVEMDYDYETFTRRTEADREVFVSVWDDPANPENYMEVRYDTGKAELVADAISATLSGEYDVRTDYDDLARAGRCIRIAADIIKGTNQMPDQLQMVYVIPAADGCRVVTEHCFIAESEGFYRRFDYLLDTLTVIGRSGENTLSDEQALTAIRNYCIRNNPDLENIANEGEYPTYWEVTASSETEVVVLYRSYTGAQVRYYIDRATGSTYVTEFVPGITPEEARTEETLNVRDYLS